MSVAGIAAVICVGLTYVVARGEPFQLTTDFVRSEEPLTVSVNPSLPAAAEVGEIVVRIGTGLGLEELELQPVSKPARARSERADTFDDTTWAYAIRSPSPILEQPDRSCCRPILDRLEHKPNKRRMSDKLGVLSPRLYP